MFLCDALRHDLSGHPLCHPLCGRRSRSSGRGRPAGLEGKKSFSCIPCSLHSCIFTGIFYLNFLNPVFCPAIGTAYRLLPALKHPAPDFLFNLWEEAAVRFPSSGDLFLIFPESHCKTCQIGSSHGGCFHTGRAVYLDAG